MPVIRRRLSSKAFEHGADQLADAAQAPERNRHERGERDGGGEHRPVIAQHEPDQQHDGNEEIPVVAHHGQKAWRVGVGGRFEPVELGPVVHGEEDGEIIKQRREHRGHRDGAVGMPVKSAIRNAAVPITGGSSAPPVEAVASIAPA